jgi:hypothetical protein
MYIEILQEVKTIYTTYMSKFYVRKNDKHKFFKDKKDILLSYKRQGRLTDFATHCTNMCSVLHYIRVPTNETQQIHIVSLSTDQTYVVPCTMLMRHIHGEVLLHGTAEVLTH